MAVMSFYVENPLKIFDDETKKHVILKLGMKHPWLEA